MAPRCFLKVFLTAFLILGIVGTATFPTSVCAQSKTSAKKTTKKSSSSKKKPSSSKKKSSTKKSSKSRNRYKARTPQSVKGMWLSQFDLQAVYTADGKQREEGDYTARIKQVLQNVKSCGVNTIIVQLRPNGDSMYPSDVYPMSKYVVGAYGRDADYDAFAILLKEAHALRFSVHAWINPIRLMEIDALGAINDRYQLKKWLNEGKQGTYLIQCNGLWYLNPAYEETRNLIIEGAAEIIRKYDVDGLHMDDYFYPTGDASFDAAAYNDYKAGGGELDLANFRRQELNKLVKGLYDATKKANPSALYGISPAGNIRNVRNGHFADVDTWCSQEGYIDYICPQVYWGFNHSICPFEPTCNVWQDLIKTPKVKLWIGMTLGNTIGANGEWASRDVILRCLQATQKLEKCCGAVFFCYQYCFTPGNGEPRAESAEERSKFVPYFKTMKWSPARAKKSK